MSNPSTQANTLYPGLPNYVGETEGWFYLLHHAECIVEYSWNVMERIECINTEKPEHERETRLRHIVYVPEELVPVKLRKAVEAYGKAKGAYVKAEEAYVKAGVAANKSKKLLAYLHKHVPDCKWNSKEIVFPPKP